ncbi:MAG TPA: DPM/DPG synthase family glycosyltransferase [Gemmatimonadaceae bacterium]|nr:DPM/DPG synthase family glycosyltransferase [Gemmatimonadaceae bacterium]
MTKFEGSGARGAGSGLATRAPAATPSPTSALPTSRSPVPAVSILVPAKDEAENLRAFMEQTETMLAAAPFDAEVVIIDDGSDDETPRVISELEDRYPFLRSARHRTRRGIADALRTGFLHARGDVLVFYPADLQFRPEDIPRLVAPILSGESDMVTGYKEGKYEKAFVSNVYNALSRSLFNVRVRDLNSVKAYRREVMDALPVRPDWHRFMVVLAAAEGFTVSEVPVRLYPRQAGKSKFGIGRIPVGVLDMLAVWFEMRFGRKPLLLFGMLGAALFAIGALAGVAALIALAVAGVGFRSVWTVIQTCLILGSVFFATGLLGEVIAGQRSEIRELRRRLEELSVDRTNERDAR